MKPGNSVNPQASVSAASGEGGSLIITITGRLDSETAGSLWRRATVLLERAGTGPVIVDASGIEYCDGSGVGLLFDLRRRRGAGTSGLEIRGLREEFSRLLDLFEPAEFEQPRRAKERGPGLIGEIGLLAETTWNDIKTLISFVGELAVALLLAVIHPRRTRWKDALRTVEAAGVNALPIIALVSALIGLVMAFQAAVALRMFGAEIYVANLVSMSMLRELGPLMTAIILAGRSGSAFAAELGTMKVNEEIDAITTMGLDPVRFLTVTRVIAAVVVTPMLTVFSNLFGIAGGAVVMLFLGFPLVTYVNQVTSFVDLSDLLGGLAKAVVFGLLVAAVGCLRGLQTRTGASAVGESATSAVVSGIVLIIVTDGIFTVLYYYIGI